MPVFDNSQYLFDTVTGKPITLKDAGATDKEAIAIRNCRFRNKMIPEMDVNVSKKF